MSKPMSPLERMQIAFGIELMFWFFVVLTNSVVVVWLAVLLNLVAVIIMARHRYIRWRGDRK
jgi:membrane protein YdbS with pleckstrin-like domain